jgi:hypothetical protein
MFSDGMSVDYTNASSGVQTRAYTYSRQDDRGNFTQPEIFQFAGTVYLAGPWVKSRPAPGAEVQITNTYSVVKRWSRYVRKVPDVFNRLSWNHTTDTPIYPAGWYQTPEGYFWDANVNMTLWMEPLSDPTQPKMERGTGQFVLDDLGRPVQFDFERGNDTFALNTPPGTYMIPEIEYHTEVHTVKANEYGRFMTFLKRGTADVKAYYQDDASSFEELRSTYVIDHHYSNKDLSMILQPRA